MADKKEVAVVDPVQAEEEKKKESKEADMLPKTKEDEEEEDEMSEEDRKLKETLDLLVVQVMKTFADPKDDALQKSALDKLSDQVRSSTSSMTSVPKPLKFLRPHFKEMKEFFAKMREGINKKLLSDLLSVLAMTFGQKDGRESLKFRLSGSSVPLSSWGHEYIRNLSGEIGAEYNERTENDEKVEDLIKLVDEIIPFDMKHNSEADACDLLMEVSLLDKIQQYITKDNHARVCRYLLSCVDYISDETESAKLMEIVATAYRKCGQLADSLRVAIKLNKQELVREIFDESKGLVTKQLAFIIGSVKFPMGDIEDEDEELLDLIGNEPLTELYGTLASELDVQEAKTPEDIYKTHLADSHSNRMQRSRPANVDSARKNLASSFVNGFVNAGFSKDKMITPKGSEWIFKNKDHGMISAAASLGMVYLWNTEVGGNEIDKYSLSKQDNIKAGALLAIGICCAGVTGSMSMALPLLQDHVEDKNDTIKMMAILGIGIAYVGTGNEETSTDVLLPIITLDGQTMEVASIASLALGMIFCGTGNEEISAAIVDVFLAATETQCNDSAAIYMCLGLGLLYLGQGEECEAILEMASAFENPISKYLTITVETCAHAGSGNVLLIQKLLKIISEHIEDEKLNRHQSVAVLGLALVAMGEDLGKQMIVRSMDHILQYAEVNVKRAVPIAFALLSVSHPDVVIMDTLSKLSHDSDQEVSQNAILALGIIGAGTNNSRVAGLLRQLSSYYAREANHLFLVRISQGLLHLGKGLLTLDPRLSDGLLVSKSALCGLLTVLHSSFDMKNTILAKRHYMLYTLACGMRPRMLMTVDEKLNPIPVKVRVGQAVDTAGKAGKPKTITGFQTHKTPVLLAHGERAELASDYYKPMTNVLEGVVIVEKNPDALDEEG
eukprot:CAMPEP_0114510354 /NCGR_PEP_ID=MMETSP0109-20121206/13736_1 /TAXON_ID=29199 /ORGANISM="Chlorarachnion reptans, Strain CCCM449" /LENGTH=896 /DNA_ID=CAMNT_0001689643 /DNA_START=152 /DNA_END=2842 /DNA_ORIENTATION=+